MQNVVYKLICQRSLIAIQLKLLANLKHSLQGFSGYIKITFLNSYEENCLIQNCYICNKQTT